ncbi:MAG: mannonate dehydratase [Saprospiraceae bacterium]
MIGMEQMMRWFGPNDPVSLRDIRQAGCSGVVTALHHIPVGAVWTAEEIRKRKGMIEAAGLTWSVVESLPVHEDIKKRTGQFRQYIRNYQTSLYHLGQEDIRIITYNFMPILDWVRTNLEYEVADGSKALRFELEALIAFDLFMLKRPLAKNAYTEQQITLASECFKRMGEPQKKKLYDTILQGLPGSEESFTPSQILAALQEYHTITPARLKAHLFAFLEDITPVAEEAGVVMAIHPDDPPFSVLGLPRIVSTETDVAELLSAVPSPANGLCFCTGSYGARPDNDVKNMASRFADRIYFLHLRNTKRESSEHFFEADHLDGDTDLAGVVLHMVREMQRRGAPIPVRPDHGHQMLDDLHKKTYPGYSAIGRLRGLAEIRGLQAGIMYLLQSSSTA